MGARVKKRLARQQPEPDINVTPLVDIVLVLLIIFMVVTPSLAQGETIELPEVFRIDKAPKDLNPAKLVLAANGKVLLDGKAIPATSLEERLKRIHSVDAKRQVLLNTDSKVPYLRVRNTLAMLQDIGFKGVSLKVRPKKEDG